MSADTEPRETAACDMDVETDEPVEQPVAKPAEEPQNGVSKNDEDDDAVQVDILEYAHISVSVLIPVSITMLVVVVAVRVLFVQSVDVTSVFTMDMSGIVESTSSSTAEKLIISIVSALIFLLVMIGVTMLLVVLYKKGYIKVIIAWLVLSVLMLYCVAGSFFAYQFLIQCNIPFDYISFAVIIANIAALCTLSVFWIGPRWLNQAALILISIITVCHAARLFHINNKSGSPSLDIQATYLSQLPEWTTWAILIVIACYGLSKSQHFKKRTFLFTRNGALTRPLCGVVPEGTAQDAAGDSGATE